MERLGGPQEACGLGQEALKDRKIVPPQSRPFEEEGWLRDQLRGDDGGEHRTCRKEQHDETDGQVRRPYRRGEEAQHLTGGSESLIVCVGGGPLRFLLGLEDQEVDRGRGSRIYEGVDSEYEEHLVHRVSEQEEGEEPGQGGEG